ncbi:hypothetical protein PC116_g29653 [Phytophthora cactorum]|nr:hypothetical protein PC116_g29653 [Phytophthora cactorum]
MAEGTTPTYMGLQGRSLSIMVSTVATTGFLLFGYDQGVYVEIPIKPPYDTTCVYSSSATLLRTALIMPQQR